MKRFKYDDQPRAAPSRPICDQELLKFYEKFWLPIAAPFVLSKLAMLGGTCRMDQRELVLQYWDYPQRNCVFRSQGKVITMLSNVIRNIANFRTDADRLPVNIHFGPVWPAQHMEQQPRWTPSIWGEKLAAPQQFPPNVDVLKPRKFERTQRKDSARGELVLDVDMPEARRIALGCCPCGERKCVCQICWTLFMLPAQRILTYLVRDYFKFKRCFTVFSGRRGFHMWIMDKRVLEWTFHERRAFIDCITAPLKMAQNGAQHRDPLSDFVWEFVIKDLGVASRDEAFCRFYPELDERVSRAADHLHKLPLMLNANTGNFCDILDDPDSKYRFLARPDQIITMWTQEPPLDVVMGACVRKLGEILSEE